MRKLLNIDTVYYYLAVMLYIVSLGQLGYLLNIDYTVNTVVQVIIVSPMILLLCIAVIRDLVLLVRLLR